MGMKVVKEQVGEMKMEARQGTSAVCRVSELVASSMKEQTQTRK